MVEYGFLECFRSGFRTQKNRPPACPSTISSALRYPRRPAAAPRCRHLYPRSSGDTPEDVSRTHCKNKGCAQTLQNKGCAHTLQNCFALFPRRTGFATGRGRSRCTGKISSRTLRPCSTCRGAGKLSFGIGQDPGFPWIPGRGSGPKSRPKTDFPRTKKLPLPFLQIFFSDKEILSQTCQI